MTMRKISTRGKLAYPTKHDSKGYPIRYVICRNGSPTNTRLTRRTGEHHRDFLLRVLDSAREMNKYSVRAGKVIK